jgi:hypothetical protein
MKVGRFSLLCAVFAAALLVGSSLPSFGAGFVFDPLNQNQGFNFARDVQDPIGFLHTLKIGTTAITPDLQFRSPVDLTTEHKNLPKHVGVLSKISWGGGQGDPFEFQTQISTYNKQKISSLLHTALSNINLEFSFVVWDYDPIMKKYFPALYGGTDSNSKTVLKGLIYKEGKDLQIKIEGKGEVQSPENWGLTLKVAPQAIDQDVTFVVGVPNNVQAKVVKQWGVKVTP